MSKSEAKYFPCAEKAAAGEHIELVKIHLHREKISPEELWTVGGALIII